MTIKDVSQFGLVADVGGTNTRLGRVGPDGVLTGSIVKKANDDYDSFADMARAYLPQGDAPARVVVAVAGPVAGQEARLTNRNWTFEAGHLAEVLNAGEVLLMNDLEALGAAVPSVPKDAVLPLHEDAVLGAKGQALVAGLGTGFNIAAINTDARVVFKAEQGHVSLPVPVWQLLDARLPSAERFQTVEHVFSGVGLVRLARALGLNVDSAAEVGASDDPRACAAIELCTDAFALMLRELAYMYFPGAGIFLNGSLAREVVAPHRRERVLAHLRADTQFDGQFAEIPVFLFTSDTVALWGCSARLLGR